MTRNGAAGRGGVDGTEPALFQQLPHGGGNLVAHAGMSDEDLVLHDVGVARQRVAYVALKHLFLLAAVELAHLHGAALVVHEDARPAAELAAQVGHQRGAPAAGGEEFHGVQHKRGMGSTVQLSRLAGDVGGAHAGVAHAAGREHL